MKSSEITFWKGLEANRKSQVPKEGEPLWVTDTKKFYIGDGTTPGGILQDTHVALSSYLTSTSTNTALTSKGAKELQDGKVPNSRVLTDVPASAKFTDTISPDASDTVKGIVELATGTETTTGTDTTKAVTPAGLKKLVQTPVSASAKFTDTVTVVSDSLASNSSTTALSSKSGKTLQDTKAPILNPTFTGNPKSVTPASSDNDTSIATTAFVKSWVKTTVPATAKFTDTVTIVADASATAKGIVELATNAEITTGTDTSRAITPAGLKSRVAVPVPAGAKFTDTAPSDATLTVKGIVELATNTEIATATDTKRAITPAGLKSSINNTLTAATSRQSLSAAQGKILQDKKAPLASPTFTGDPKAPTPTALDNDKSIANTEFVRSEIVSHAQIGKNLFINGDFSRWERGTTFNIADGMVVSYTSDRWIVQHSTLVKKVESTERNYISVDASGRYSGIQQRIENAQSLNGKKVSLSFWWYTTSTVPIEHANVMFKFSSSDDAHRYFAGLHIQPTATPTKVEFPDIQLPSNYVKGDYLEFRLSASDLVSLGENLHIGDIQLELGSECTDFEYVDPTINLMRCQRYYRNLGGLIGVFSAAAGLYDCHFSYDWNTMYMEPSVSIIGSKTSAVVRNGRGVANITSTSINSSRSLINIKTTATDPLYQGESVSLNPNIIALDSEIY